MNFEEQNSDDLVNRAHLNFCHLLIYMVSFIDQEVQKNPLL